jgi:hypothetical protein
VKKKTEMTKLQRKRLERELVRNHRQRKENKREMNRLTSLYPSYSIMRRKRAFILLDEEEDMASVNRLHGEAVRGVLA